MRNVCCVAGGRGCHLGWCGRWTVDQLTQPTDRLVGSGENKAVFNASSGSLLGSVRIEVALLSSRSDDSTAENNHKQYELVCYILNQMKDEHRADFPLGEFASVKRSFPTKSTIESNFWHVCQGKSQPQRKSRRTNSPCGKFSTSFIMIYVNQQRH